MGAAYRPHRTAWWPGLHARSLGRRWTAQNPCDRRRASRHLELLEDVLEMASHGVGRGPGGARRLPVRPPGRNESDHFALAGCQQLQARHGLSAPRRAGVEAEEM